MISTADFQALPDSKNLQRICKAISVLDAILSQEWQYRYYSYNSKWAEGEECLQMRNGSGDEMLVLFKAGGCAVNGFAHEYEQPEKQKLTRNLPATFSEFIFGEPVNSIGTTFCLWTDEKNKWQIGLIDNFDDDSKELLNIFDGNPQTYFDWAVEYYEDGFSASSTALETIIKVYNGEVLNKQMVLSIVDKLEDWGQLKKDLAEINYPYKFGWF